jgi:hypothetical protein
MQKNEYILVKEEEEEVLLGGTLGPGAAIGTFRLFLLPARRPGHRFTGADEEDPAAAGATLFLLP